MKKALSHRRNIPFFYAKNETEFRQDPYEHFDSMVFRQSALHLADDFWGHYPFQSINDWILGHCPPQKGLHIAEIGCSVGRLIATIAQQREATCWGLDFSYQMLRQAQDFWVKGKSLTLDYRHRGLGQCEIAGHQLERLHFGLAKAEQLPFELHSQDVICSSFLLDRMESPELALAEMYRVLKPGGLILLVSPLNFQRTTNWEQWYPVEVLIEQLTILGFQVQEQMDWKVIEPLDARGNAIQWNCVGLALSK